MRCFMIMDFADFILAAFLNIAKNMIPVNSGTIDRSGKSALKLLSDFGRFIFIDCQLETASWITKTG